MNPWHIAYNELKESLSKYRLWLYLGHVEIQQKYRRSVIGPWWITISMFIFILAMGMVFSRLFKQDMATYLPNFTTGFLLWSFFSSCALESTETFRQNAGFIKQVKLPHVLYVLKHLTKQIIILGHNSIVYLIITAYYFITPNINTLWFIPGFLLFITNIFWICLLISMVCTRFRDMTPIISSLVQIAFFITPVSWSSQLLDNTSLVLKLNPLFYLIDIVKAPLLGNAPMAASWAVLSISAAIGTMGTFLLYSKKRNLIPFWVN